MALASVELDETNFANEQAKDPAFTSKREATFARLARAAELYARALPSLDESKQSAEAHQTWFYASLGASDLEAVRHEHQPAAKQWPLIKAAIDALPGEAAARHRDLFANALTTRMSAVQPELKHRYLGAGLQIVGDSERSRQARDLFAYYDDIAGEIRLDVKIDGTDTVGHAEPFGVFINLRHTKAIERESGGFQRYLQNQNNQVGFYNFGRPMENYRDKFEEAARQALDESFDVVAMTFHSDKVQSRGDAEDGWRVTPYAYALLRPKGPQVDAIPSLKINMDFLDTSGYVILPIESPRVPIDARPAQGSPRPMTEVEVRQILDERKADQGELGLEIKATAHGVLPPVATLVDLRPSEWEVVRGEDEGVKIVQLDAEADENSVVCERLWTVALKAKPGLPEPPRVFHFACAERPRDQDESLSLCRRRPRRNGAAGRVAAEIRQASISMARPGRLGGIRGGRNWFRRVVEAPPPPDRGRAGELHGAGGSQSAHRHRTFAENPFERAVRRP